MSRAYYNEIDPKAAAWLRELIAQGHIAPGDVDERSIVDVTAPDLEGYTQCHFFAGIGVWSHALRLAGWPDDEPVWTGSCPCQPFSVAGRKGGIDDDRHLWPHWFTLIAECQPAVVFGEQVASPDGLKWLDAVSLDLEAADYTLGAADLCAAGVGAPHIRQRLYFVGRRSWPYTNDSNTNGRYRTVQMGRLGGAKENASIHDRSRTQWTTEPRPALLAYGAPARVGRVCGYGNAIVAPLAQAFIESSVAAMQDMQE